MSTTTQRQPEKMIDVDLNAPNTPEDRLPSLKNNLHPGPVTDILPYIDDADGTGGFLVPVKQSQYNWPNDGKPRLRFFNAGPTSYQILCPLCLQRAETETVQMGGIIGSLSCLLSMFSCCFPIFSLSFVYLCLQSRLKSKRVFCSKCGGYVGCYRRPV